MASGPCVGRPVRRPPRASAVPYNQVPLGRAGRAAAGPPRPPERRTRRRPRAAARPTRGPDGPTLRPPGRRGEVAAPLAGARRLPRRRRVRPAQVLLPGLLPLPLRRRALRRSLPQLRAHRRGRALQAHARLQRPPPDGLGRLRPAGRELRPQDGRPPARDDGAQHRQLPPPDGPHRPLLRLVARDHQQRARLLPLDAVVLPAHARARARLPRDRPAVVVPELQDDPRQRAGRAGALLALRQRRDQEGPRAVVLPHHRLRAAPARRPRDHRVARADQAHADELDRAQRRRRGRLRPARPRRAAHRVHDAAGHALRRHLHGARPRAPAGRRADDGRAPRGRRRLQGPGPPPERDRAPLDREGEDRRLHRRLRGQPGERRAGPDLDQRLRAHGLRHRGDHGGAGARRARLRVRHAVRAADRRGHRAARPALRGR